MNYGALLATVAPVFLVILAGYVIRRVGWLTEEADGSLMRVIVNLLYPCLILDTILGNPALSDTGNLVAPVAGFVTVVGGYLVSYFLAPFLGLRDPRLRRTFAFTTGLYNYGYVPLPLVQKLFDPQTTAVLFIHNIGVEVAIWTVGIALVSGSRPGSARGILGHVFNPPVVAILAAITLHFAGGKLWIPEIVMSAVHSMGAAAIPLGLILTGATFADQLRDLAPDRGGRISMASAALRLVIIPLLMLALARWLPASIELRRIIVVQAAMPCAVIPVILAKHYGGSPAVSMRIVLTTTLLGLVTIPLWLQIGLRLAGLQSW